MVQGERACWEPGMSRTAAGIEPVSSKDIKGRHLLLSNIFSQ